MTGPGSASCLQHGWGRENPTQTAPGEALTTRHRTGVQFPPSPQNRAPETMRFRGLFWRCPYAGVASQIGCRATRTRKRPRLPMWRGRSQEVLQHWIASRPWVAKRVRQLLGDAAGTHLTYHVSFRFPASGLPNGKRRFTSHDGATRMPVYGRPPHLWGANAGCHRA